MHQFLVVGSILYAVLFLIIVHFLLGEFQLTGVVIALVVGIFYLVLFVLLNQLTIEAKIKRSMKWTGLILASFIALACGARLVVMSQGLPDALLLISAGTFVGLIVIKCIIISVLALVAKPKKGL